MDEHTYAMSLKALWAIPAVLNTVDLNATLAEAQRRGSDAEIMLIKLCQDLRPLLPDQPT